MQREATPEYKTAETPEAERLFAAAERAVGLANTFNLKSRAEINELMGEKGGKWFQDLEKAEEIIEKHKDLSPEELEKLADDESRELAESYKLFSEYRGKLVNGLRSGKKAIKPSDAVPWFMGNEDERLDYAVADKMTFTNRFGETVKASGKSPKVQMLTKNRRIAEESFKTLNRLFGPRYEADMKGRVKEGDFWHALRLKSGAAWSSEAELTEEEHKVFTGTAETAEESKKEGWLFIKKPVATVKFKGNIREIVYREGVIKLHINQRGNYVVEKVNDLDILPGTIYRPEELPQYIREAM